MSCEDCEEENNAEVNGNTLKIKTITNETGLEKAEAKSIEVEGSTEEEVKKLYKFAKKECE